MNETLVVVISLAYLALLFVIAYVTERRSASKKSTTGGGWVYALSLAVYCTGWTYYGSVGSAANSGPAFLTIYLGPLIMCTLFLPVLQKIVRICKAQNISTIADFISTRYGKNFSLGIIVTLCCVIGIIPYISLQLKAISNSYHVITGTPLSTKLPVHVDDSLYIAIIMMAFIILFGTRSVDSSERHEGVVTAVAFESVVKLVVFVAAGVFVTYGIYNGFDDLTTAAKEHHLEKMLNLSGDAPYSNWIAMLLVAMMSLIMLPRQFQVAVVENTNEQHIRHAMWRFPLYLLLINLFVLPIAIAGKLMMPAGADADTYVLSIPLASGAHSLGVMVYLGGLSAASSMIIVETIALATMVSNHLILPTILSAFRLRVSSKPLSSLILFIRRASIVIILLLAYLYDRYVAAYFPLVSIGVVSMAAVAQFAPAIFGGLFWKGATRKGAIAAIISGFVIWWYTLVFPSWIEAGFASTNILHNGPWGLWWLAPTHLLGLAEFGPLAHAVFWSMLTNVGVFVSVSLFSKATPEELFQAEIFTNVMYETDGSERRSVWKGTAYIADIRRLMANFIGRERAYRLIASYAQRHQINTDNKEADPRIVVFSEKILSGIIGSASARFMMSNITKEEHINLDEVLDIVRESQQVLELNKELRRKSIELTRATTLLQQANDQLVQADTLKDEFLYTVTHELRTPLTSIRAMSEIVYDYPDMDEETRQQYLGNIVAEIERLSHLITQVLNLEKYESGRQKLHLQTVDIASLIKEVIKSTSQLAADKQAQVVFASAASMYLVQCDKDLIRQVLYNLVSNSLKFVPAQTGNILVSVRQDNGELYVWVEDNGKGVPDELHELIFEKFFQAHNQTLRKPEGSGLGLAICRRILEMHNGRIWVENRSPMGARFIFALPYDI